ncbi:alpha/beta fold hydrolase [Cohnella sp. REN36]|uniref:alpha/beta fold hydrolase n=1 Tax=Cohnella sp. REN36 TaxID=2887347 RepID=UPI001D156377|nr:alpha/beta fold hydrolase [Cohnella sp. REN36]MCC3371764.1 alpha/beta hydrolase [Cohnella sp. REN36]
MNAWREGRYADNDGVRLHYLDSAAEANPALTPLVICPGLSETADEYADFMAWLLPRRSVALSFRGRGRSDAPAAGYGLAPHVSDLAAILRGLSLSEFHLFAYSRGVSYALGYASETAEGRIRSLVLADYPPMHKRMPTGWDDDYIYGYLRPEGRSDRIAEAAVRGIQAESEDVAFARFPPIPALLLYGRLADSLVLPSDVEAYGRLFPSLRAVAFDRAGHTVFASEPDKAQRELLQFLADHDRP